MTFDELDKVPYGRVIARWDTVFQNKKTVTSMVIVKDPHTFTICSECSCPLTHKSVKTRRNGRTIYTQCIVCAYKRIFKELPLKDSYEKS